MLVKGQKIEVIENHYGANLKGEELTYIKDGGYDSFLGDHVVAQDKHDEVRKVKKGYFKVLNNEIPTPKPDDIFKLKTKVNDCNKPFYRIWKINDAEITFFSDNGYKRQVHVDDIELSHNAIDDLFEAQCSLALRVVRLEKWLQRIFNDSLTKTLD